MQNSSQGFEPHAISRFSGIYALVHKNKVIYIGKSIDVEARIRAHRSRIEFETFFVKRCPPEELTRIEAEMIAEHKPPLNRLGKRLSPESKRSRHLEPKAASKSLGRSIREIRLRKGWTLEDCEDHGYSSWRHLQSIEAGKNCTLHTLVAIANLFGVPLSELFDSL